MNSHQKVFFLISVLFFTFFYLLSCSTDNENGDRFYRFIHQSNSIDYIFVAKTSDRDVIAKVEQELQKPFDERSLHINGTIARGTKDYNSDWSWYFVENQWDLAEISTEVCDGRPSFVEEDLDYWVGNVGRFCPWGSRVEEEVRQ